MVKSNFQKTKPILQDEKNLDYWNDLHDKFDVFLIDKASNIAAITFKKKIYAKKVFQALPYIMITWARSTLK